MGKSYQPKKKQTKLSVFKFSIFNGENYTYKNSPHNTNMYILSPTDPCELERNQKDFLKGR
jgi:hypothetical protein